jgi:hypothetical protein
MRFLFASLIALLAAPAMAQQQGAQAAAERSASHIPDAEIAQLQALDDNAFDAQFRCPETLADDAARRHEIARFLKWAQLRHGGWSVGQTMTVRRGLLVKHQCAATLRNMDTRPGANPGDSALPPPNF